MLSVFLFKLCNLYLTTYTSFCLYNSDYKVYRASKESSLLAVNSVKCYVLVL